MVQIGLQASMLLPRVRVRILALAFLAAIDTHGQSLHLGFKGGVPLSDFFKTGSTQIGTRTLQHSVTYDSVPKRYTFGPTAEVKVLDGFSVEIGALYKRVNYSKAGTTSFIDFQALAPATITFNALVTGNSLEFPLVAKYRLPRGGTRPYLAGGLAGRYLQGLRLFENQVIETVASGAVQRSEARVETGDVRELSKRFYPGVTLAGGLEFGAEFARIAPELRYTRWVAFTSGQTGPLRFEANQFEILLCVLF